MKHNRQDIEQIINLLDALADETLVMTKQEIIDEAAELGEDIESTITETRNVIQNAINSAGRTKLAAARSAYEAHTSKPSGQILSLPMDKKKALLRSLGSEVPNLTLAARKGDDDEADIDTLLENLIDLGVIKNLDSLK